MLKNIKCKRRQGRNTVLVERQLYEIDDEGKLTKKVAFELKPKRSKEKVMKVSEAKISIISK